MILLDVEAELKSRFSDWASFNKETSLKRLRYSEVQALRKIWHSHEWDFRKSSATIVTTDGNLGPYTAPTGMVRFCHVRRVSYFGYEDKYSLAPMVDGDDRALLYLNAMDGNIYFVSNPGNQSLTLNYIGYLSNSSDETTLTASMALFPDYLMDSFMEFVTCDFKKYLPGMTEEALLHERMGKQMLEDLWADSNSGKWSRTISTKGLNRVSNDFIARQINIMGELTSIQSEDAT